MVTLITVMPLIRKRLASAVAGWLVLQLAALCAAPIAQRVVPIDASAEACSCPDGMPADHCPMHSGHDLHQSPARCAMRSTLGQFDATLLTLMTPGVLPLSRFVPHVPRPVDLLAERQLPAVSRSQLPDFPPPRS